MLSKILTVTVTNEWFIIVCYLSNEVYMNTLKIIYLGST